MFDQRAPDSLDPSLLSIDQVNNLPALTSLEFKELPPATRAYVSRSSYWRLSPETDFWLNTGMLP